MDRQRPPDLSADGGEGEATVFDGEDTQHSPDATTTPVRAQAIGTNSAVAVVGSGNGGISGVLRRLPGGLPAATGERSPTRAPVRAADPDDETAYDPPLVEAGFGGPAAGADEAPAPARRFADPASMELSAQALGVVPLRDMTPDFEPTRNATSPVVRSEERTDARGVLFGDAPTESGDPSEATRLDTIEAVSPALETTTRDGRVPAGDGPTVTRVPRPPSTTERQPRARSRTDHAPLVVAERTDPSVAWEGVGTEPQLAHRHVDPASAIVLPAQPGPVSVQAGAVPDPRAAELRSGVLSPIGGAAALAGPGSPALRPGTTPAPRPGSTPALRSGTTPAPREATPLRPGTRDAALPRPSASPAPRSASTGPTPVSSPSPSGPHSGPPPHGIPAFGSPHVLGNAPLSVGAPRSPAPTGAAPGNASRSPSPADAPPLPAPRTPSRSRSPSHQTVPSTLLPKPISLPSDTHPLLRRPDVPPLMPPGASPTGPPALAPTLPSGFAPAVPPGFSATVPPGFAGTLPLGFPGTVPPGYPPTMPPGFSATVPPGYPPTMPPSLSPTVPPVLHGHGHHGHGPAPHGGAPHGPPMYAPAPPKRRDYATVVAAVLVAIALVLLAAVRFISRSAP